MTQWVCKVCGYNMIGNRPDVCPFCGAKHDEFVTSEEAEQLYRVTPSKVTDQVMQLMSVPRLGLEHAAYRVETDQGPVWIDCPSAFNRDIEPAAAILFTHKDFMGASNQYRELWDAQVYIHELDARHPLARNHPVDHPFSGDFKRGSLEAYHIGGHTPGYTMYIHHDVLFACDYVFPPGAEMKLNPASDAREMRARGGRVLDITEGRGLRKVCGYNYVADFLTWRADFLLILQAAA